MRVRFNHGTVTATLLVLTCVMPCAQAAEQDAPAIELLEMLGEVGDIDELGVPVDRLIQERLNTHSNSENEESE